LEFRVGVLAQALEISRLEALQQLAEIEEQTDLIYDLRRSDDVFAFRSSVNLEVVRQRSGIRIQGPTENGMAQIIREYHARIAKVLADQYPQGVYSIADHFYAAGLACSEEAIDACLQAAQAALQQFAVTDARRYLEMIGEYQQMVDHPPREADLICLSADLAHISGQDRAIAAEEGLTFLQHTTSPAADIALLVARSCYDAGTDEEGQRYFVQAVRLGQLTANNPTASRLQQAEGLHFVGISLPASEPQQRESYLRQSLGLISDAPTEDITAQRLLARIHNSLARQLESTSPTKAESFYQRSLEIKQRPKIRDLNGLAITHNGLGRLVLDCQPPDLETAIYHFQQSLTYAQEMGSPMDMSKSHSFLGLCARQQEDYTRAAEEYRQSYRLAQSPVDRGFAGAGLLESYAELGDKTNLSAFGQELAAQLVADGGVPTPCQDRLTSALEQCRTLMHDDRIQADWIHELEEMTV